MHSSAFADLHGETQNKKFCVSHVMTTHRHEQAVQHCSIAPPHLHLTVMWQCSTAIVHCLSVVRHNTVLLRLLLLLLLLLVSHLQEAAYHGVPVIGIPLMIGHTLTSQSLTACC
jgi:hypothetical protein